MATSAKARYITADATISAFDAVAVTPSDSTTIPVTRGLYIGVSGDVSVLMWQGTTAIFKNAVQGTVLPVQVTQVNSTSTTATNLLALY